MRLGAVLAIVGALGATAAEAMPEGRFATADGGARVLLQRVADGALRVEIDVPAFGPLLQVSLVPRPDGRVFEEPAAPAGWMDRLMSRQPERLPFDGRRLAWATQMEDALVVTTLQVDASGRPDLRRAALSLTDDTTLRLDLRRYADMEVVPGPHLQLERAAP